MMRYNINVVNEKEYSELIELAKKVKGEAQLNVEAPVGDEIFIVLQNNNIILLQYPIEREGSDSFSALLLIIEDQNQKYAFLGLNTQEYYDKQIFAIAHEIYHWKEKSSPHISRDEELVDKFEVKADLFAAEMLLPIDILANVIVKEFRKSSISSFTTSKLLRFIANIHCTWKLPYKSIIKRLREVNAIDQAKFAELYEIDERDINGEYYKIGLATNKMIFESLNCKTKTIGAYAPDLEIFIRNFEDGFIDESELLKGLQLFDKTPDNFGLTFDIEEDEEMNIFFERGDEGES